MKKVILDNDNQTIPIEQVNIRKGLVARAKIDGEVLGFVISNASSYRLVNVVGQYQHPSYSNIQTLIRAHAGLDFYQID